MIRISGIYDGEIVRPLEPVEAEPNTRVEISFPEKKGSTSRGSTKEEMIERLFKAGLISKKLPGGPMPKFDPIEIEGPPLSQAIIEERDETL